MPFLTVPSVVLGTTDYPAVIDSIVTAIVAAVNDLANQILAGVGDGSLLILDGFDRDGTVGSASYQLDLENYAGGSQITIGRRPLPNVPQGDQDVSIAWVTAGGQRNRVTMSGDLVLDA